MAKKRTEPELKFEQTSDKIDNAIETLNALSNVESEELVPAKTDPSWHDYVMKQFKPYELQDNFPKVDGLRRMVRVLIGEIVGCEIKPVYVNKLSACVTVKILVNGKDGINYFYEEIADVHDCNTDSDYVRHAPATAATKAEARAYRKLLNLRTVAYEEKPTAVPNSLVDDTEQPSKIIGQQINVLRILCNRNGLSLKKYSNAGETKYQKLEEIPFEKAQAMIQYLSDAVHKKLLKDEWYDDGKDETWNN